MSENSERAVTERRPWQFKPGVGPNPGGRPRVEGDVRALAQKHGPEAIRVLAECLKSRNERIRVAAASVLLDRAYGKAPQALVGEDGESLSLLHLIAARQLNEQLQIATAEARAAISSAEATQPVIDVAAWEKLPPALE